MPERFSEGTRREYPILGCDFEFVNHKLAIEKSAHQRDFSIILHSARSLSAAFVLRQEVCLRYPISAASAAFRFPLQM